MVIDQTRYSAFLKNPEYFRLRYMLDLDRRIDADLSKNYGRDRGTVFHRLAEFEHCGMADTDSLRAITGEVSNADSVKMGAKLYAAYKKATQHKYEKIAAEVEFTVPIADSDHSIAGRIDAVVLTHDSPRQAWAAETKTGGRQTKLDKIKREWRFNPQADFEIIGARSLGFPVNGVLVHTIVEATPQPRVWETRVERSQEQLNVMLWNVRQVCDMIQLLVRSYGVERPWPHIPTTYNPCESMDKCDYDRDCRCILGADVLTEYVKRDEHLKQMESGTWRN